MGQVPMAAARDGLFPPLFSRLSARNVPAIGIVVSATLATLLILVEAVGSEGFSAFYTLVVGLSTMAAVIPYAFCALAGSLVSARVSGGVRVPRVSVVEVVAFLFAMFTLYGCGAEPVLYGLVLLLLGIPVFVWQRDGRVRPAYRTDVTPSEGRWAVWSREPPLSSVRFEPRERWSEDLAFHSGSANSVQHRGASSAGSLHLDLAAREPDDASNVDQS